MAARPAPLRLAAWPLLLAACQCAAAPGPVAPPGDPPTDPPAAGAPHAIDVRLAPPAGGLALRLVPFATGFASPWALAFLPDGRVLVTEKGGTLQLVAADGASRRAVAGVPAVDAGGQGGLLDVAVDRDFATNRRVWLAFSERGAGAEAGLAGTALLRAELDEAGPSLANGAVVFRQRPKVSGGGHYGARIVQRADGTLFVTLGERQKGAPAQDPAALLGKVVRLDADGRPAAGNPALGAGAAPELWTLGHRNPQAAALHPVTGELWVVEHGSQGGDEVNVALPGRNFGWPTVAYGCQYGAPVGEACRIGGGVHAPAFAEPQAYWFPTSTAPGGMAFYTGAAFPEWRGDLFVGGLAGATLWRLRLDGRTVTAHEALFRGVHELRDVRQGPDGLLYLVTRDGGDVLRVER